MPILRALDVGSGERRDSFTLFPMALIVGNGERRKSFMHNLRILIVACGLKENFSCLAWGYLLWAVG